MKGIDIYNGTTVVDWNAIKADGVEIIYLKATEGLTFNDNKMREFYEGAKSVGLKVGFYHYLHRNDPYQEAQHFINMVSGLQADCKYMIDVEDEEFKSSGGNETSTRVRQFYDYMQSKGFECGIYTYTSFYNELFDDRIKQLPLWVANYGVQSPGVDNYIGWQYTETGTINGIGEGCDVNEFGEGICIGNTNRVVKESLTAQPVKDSGIKDLQHKLNILLKKGLAEDGISGPSTDGALREFQQTMGLAQDGVPGPATNGAISEILARPVDGVPFPHYEYATRYIQYRCGGSIDGSFGSGTKIHVQNWQANHGLGADGVVGAGTWSKLLDENC